MKSSRRVFLMTVAAGTSLIGTAVRAQVQVEEKDPQATALGYKADATKIDAKKFPRYAAGQKCSTCALYQGKPDSAAGGCPLFGTKQVAAPGWCTAWVQKT